MQELLQWKISVPGQFVVTGCRLIFLDLELRTNQTNYICDDFQQNKIWNTYIPPSK